MLSGRADFGREKGPFLVTIINNPEAVRLGILKSDREALMGDGHCEAAAGETTPTFTPVFERSLASAVTRPPFWAIPPNTMAEAAGLPASAARFAHPGASPVEPSTSGSTVRGPAGGR